MTTTMQDIHYQRLIGAGYSPEKARTMTDEYFPKPAVELPLRVGQKLVSESDIGMVTGIGNKFVRIRWADSGKVQKIGLEKCAEKLTTDWTVLPQIRSH